GGGRDPQRGRPRPADAACGLEPAAQLEVASGVGAGGAGSEVSLLPGDTMRELLAPPKVRRVPERDVDRSPEFRWLAEQESDYRGQWVALLGEALLGSA